MASEFLHRSARQAAKKQFLGGWKSLTLGLALAISANAQDQKSENADLIAKGRQLFGTTCVQCHNSGHTVIQRKPAEGWRKTVYTMISRGAPVLPGETEALVAYLTSAYGPATNPPKDLPPGSETVAASCGTCHPAALVFGSRKSAADWTATIAKMRSLGATVTESQEKEILAYLTKNLAAQ